MEPTVWGSPNATDLKLKKSRSHFLAHAILVLGPDSWGSCCPHRTLLFRPPSLSLASCAHTVLLSGSLLAPQSQLPFSAFGAER